MNAPRCQAQPSPDAPGLQGGSDHFSLFPRTSAEGPRGGAECRVLDVPRCERKPTAQPPDLGMPIIDIRVLGSWDRADGQGARTRRSSWLSPYDRAVSVITLPSGPRSA